MLFGLSMGKEKRGLLRVPFYGTVFLTVGVKTRVATAGFEAAECMPPCWGHVWGMGTAEITRSNSHQDFFSIFTSPGDGVPQRLRGLDTKPSQMMERIATELQNALSTTQEVPPHHEITDQLMAAADPADGSTSTAAAFDAPRHLDRPRRDSYG